MKCPVCGTERRWESFKAEIESLGKCGDCYAKEQPLVKMPGGSYLPWSYVNYIRHDGSISTEIEENDDTSPPQEWNKDYEVPRVTFCDKYKKWKLSYITDSGEMNDHSAFPTERYFDSLLAIMVAMGILLSSKK